MKTFLWVILGCAASSAQTNELTFSLGGIPGVTRGAVKLGAGTALQVNYGRRLWEGNNLALYGEVHFLASPLREVASSTRTATRDVASLYVTPGVRLKLAPKSAVSPFFSVGGGWALYEHSTMRLDGGVNAAPRTSSTGALNVGAGVDVRLLRWLALRGEFRDFYSGSPNFNIAAIRGGQHNATAGAGLVIRWR